MTIARQLGFSIERKQAELQRSLLVAELSHRVKNTLATVISIARQSFSTNPDVNNAQRSFNARIRALGQTHSRLAETSWSGMALDTLLGDELAPYRLEDGSNLEVSGPSVTLTPRQALTLGMAMHELATNAAKYGALSTRNGRVKVAWDLDRARRELQVRWTEHGGPQVVTPTRYGFGRLLIERVLAADLGGHVEMDFAKDGLACIITLPLLHSLVTDEGIEAARKEASMSFGR
jgi:two-component sensor histidine kinase